MVWHTFAASKHLSILRRAGLAELRRGECWVYDRLPDKRSTAAVCEVLDWIQECLARSDEAAADHKRLVEIVKIARHRNLPPPMPARRSADFQGCWIAALQTRKRSRIARSADLEVG